MQIVFYPRASICRLLLCIASSANTAIFCPNQREKGRATGGSIARYRTRSLETYRVEPRGTEAEIFGSGSIAWQDFRFFPSRSVVFFVGAPFFGRLSIAAGSVSAAMELHGPRTGMPAIAQLLTAAIDSRIRAPGDSIARDFARTFRGKYTRFASRSILCSEQARPRLCFELVLRSNFECALRSLIASRAGKTYEISEHRFTSFIVWNILKPVLSFIFCLRSYFATCQFKHSNMQIPLKETKQCSEALI